MKALIRILLIGTTIGIILFVIGLIVQYFTGKPLVQDLLTLQNFGFYLFYSIPITAVNSSFFDYLNNRVNWERFNSRYRLVISFLGSVILTLITIFLLRAIHEMYFERETYPEFIESESALFYFTSSIITLVISLFFHVFYFYKLLQEKKVKEQKIIAGTASAKFESLKNQIDPHFLFNSLNVLTSLIEENPNNAQRFTTSLSKIYRYVLEQKDKELVSLEEELNFAIIYMNLLKMRFEDSISYEVPDLDQLNPEAKVVPLSLQLLLENTVKHNIVNSSKPLSIRIYQEHNTLVVENNYNKKEVLQNRQGVGLQNIVDRYGLITNRKVVVEQDTTYFRVKLPILTKQVNFMQTKNYDENNAYLRAKQRVKEIKDFYGNLLSYCIVIPFLIFINYRTFWEFKWFWFPLIGWGIGLVAHAATVFGYASHWEERKIQEIMEKEERKTTWN